MKTLKVSLLSRFFLSLVLFPFLVNSVNMLIMTYLLLFYGKKAKHVYREYSGRERNGTMDDEKTIFGKNLRAARKVLGMTQKDIQRVTGIEQAFLSKVECGKSNISLETMITLSNAVNVPLSHLFSPPR